MTQEGAVPVAQPGSDGASQGARRQVEVGQVAVGGAVALLALALAWGGGALPAVAQAGDDGGPRLLPWLCAGVLLLCGLWLVWEAWQGGWRQMPPPSSVGRPQITAAVWVVAGLLLLPAQLITQTGFVPAAALGYVLAVQGLRRADRQGEGLQARRLAADLGGGVVVAGGVYLLFTRVLGVTLPGGSWPWM
ncbi:tripartite tricarboxylate transporter TctB family protein [Comamonas aquatica]|uniref:tripartite tricarboxylate transporter TctB family protein n=1 Tax=Comamonas aquatica TaxID=225991 RepID=UPI0024481556|nr:tripartite tricarboxylate transporter TctB family protein [Comamonas aquatica]MDH0493257.1 tripartite tricarboxylate transporter TctB family protein [Comamonas aquatica]MDH1677446.1 tripartite tricarboxylate transporter TctB family protein [Comamonas aquatica]